MNVCPKWVKKCLTDRWAGGQPAKSRSFPAKSTRPLGFPSAAGADGLTLSQTLVKWRGKSYLTFGAQRLASGVKQPEGMLSEESEKSRRSLESCWLTDCERTKLWFLKKLRFKLKFILDLHVNWHTFRVEFSLHILWTLFTLTFTPEVNLTC